MKHIFIVIFVIGSLALVSCKKTTPPKAVITIEDVDKKPVKGAKLNINSNEAIGKSIYDTIKYTDNNGQVLFSTKFDCILQVVVTKGALKKIDYVQFKENQTTQKTIILE